MHEGRNKDFNISLHVARVSIYVLFNHLSNVYNFFHFNFSLSICIGFSLFKGIVLVRRVALWVCKQCEQSGTIPGPSSCISEGCIGCMGWLSGF